MCKKLHFLHMTIPAPEDDMTPKRARSAASLQRADTYHNPPSRAVRWSDTQQRRDFNHILKLWDEWKKNLEHDFLEIEAAADGIDISLEVMDELMKGRIIRDD
jgi:hypothetical protein